MSEQREKVSENQFSNFVIACLLIVGSITVFILILYFFTFDRALSNHERFGQFGDYVGGILNPVVAFCALMALMFGIKQQRKELKDTRDQFSEQSFDSMFFQMLQLHNNMVSSIDSDILISVYEQAPGGTKKLGKGRESFHVMYRSMQQIYWSKKMRIFPKNT